LPPLRNRNPDPHSGVTAGAKSDRDAFDVAPIPMNLLQNVSDKDKRLRVTVEAGCDRFNRFAVRGDCGHASAG